MGTLYKQSERDYDQIDELIVGAFMMKYELDDTNENILRSIELLEYKRRTDFMINNGDRFDEQMAGFGELLRDRI